MPGKKTTARVRLWGSKSETETIPVDPDTPKIEISTDGSEVEGKVGWGFVAVIEEMEIHTNKGPVNIGGKVRGMGRSYKSYQQLGRIVRSNKNAQLGSESTRGPHDNNQV